MPPAAEPAAPDTPLDTEPFSAWLRGFREARKSGGDVTVPCGECRGCCTSGYFIPIAPDERDTLAHIPKELLFPAPGLPKGHRLLGYRENGHCPLFRENRCTIYAHRPRACRQYDCRLFPATGAPVDEGKPRIAAQAVRWRFAYPEAGDREQQAAVSAAARFLDRHADRFPAGFLPGQPDRRALLALEVSEVFLGPPDGSADEAAAVRSRIAAIVAARTAMTRPEAPAP